MSRLELVPAEEGYLEVSGSKTLRRTVPFLDLVVDGVSLRETALVAGYGGPFVTPLCRAWTNSTADAVESLLAGTDEHVSLLVCAVCGDEGCGALQVLVTIEGHRVAWTDWRFVDATRVEYVTTMPKPVFERAAYELVLRAAPAAVAALPFQATKGDRRFLWPWQWGWRLPKR